MFVCVCVLTCFFVILPPEVYREAISPISYNIYMLCFALQDGHCGNFNFDPSDDSKDGKLREDLDRKTDQVIMPTNKSVRVSLKRG